MLFVKKTKNFLRLYVDYRNLNEIIIKNNYLLSLFSKILKRFAYIKRFIKINIRNAYYKIRMRKRINEKSFFEFVIINLSIKLCLLISQMLR